MEVRSFRAADAEPLGEVFHAAVRQGAVSRYAEEQVAAWSPEAPKGERWAERLSGADTVVAEEDGRLLGFMTADEAGYLDLAFVLPEAMGQGISDGIYSVLEGRARAKGISRLTTQASLLAEPFFARHGWTVVRRQEVEIGGVVLKNAWMEKLLGRREV